MHSTALAADITITTSAVEGTEKYKVTASVEGVLDDVVTVSSGDMYYTKNTYCDNVYRLKNEINYHKGLLFAVGFYRDNIAADAVSAHTIKGNILHLGSTDSETSIKPVGGMELTAGYFSKYAYGTATENKIFCVNTDIKSTFVTNNTSSGFLGLYGVFANQNSDVDRNKLVNVTKNAVIVSNSRLTAEYNYLEVFGGYPKYGVAQNNMVDITSSNFDALCGIKICGGFVEQDGDALSNITKITGTDEKQSYIQSALKDNDITDKNTILSGQETVIAGGYCYVKGNAIGNTVDLNYSNLEGSKIYGGYTASGNATGNKVTVSNSKLDGSSLYGGYSGSGGTIVGNVLNIGEKITGKLNTIGGFNAINFENINWENGGTVLKTENLELVGGEAATTRSAESANTQVFVKRITGNAKVNDYMNLIVSDNAIVGKLANAGEQEVEAGVAQVVKVVTGNLEQEANAIKFTIVDSEMNPQVEALGEASAVANAFVANGVGLVEDSINAMMCEERIGYKTFAQMHGSNLDFDTPNDLSVKGWSGIVGVGETTPDRLTYGIFFEKGKGDYHTLAQQSKGFVRGDGEVDYNGGGLLIRKDNENGVYVEASLRAGRMGNELNDAVVGNNNKLKGFDVSSFYYGAHIGIGKIIPRGERESLDVYGKFLYSYHDDDSFVIDDDKFNLDSVNSQRLRVGFRYNELNGDKLRMYYGVAYEYEFDAKARNSVLNYTFDSPDLGGGTVVGELGFHYNADEKWCFDVNLKGYGGQREGFTGSVQANYLF